MKSCAFVLLLLCCCLSEVQNERKYFSQQDNPEDISSFLSVLKDELINTATKLKHLQTRLEASESQVEELKEQLMKQKQLNEGGRVAFSAYLYKPGSAVIGPYTERTKLVFDKIITNIGDAYNPVSGDFTTPVRGVYQFNLHIQGKGNFSVPTAVDLSKNGQFIFAAHGYQSDYRVSTSNGVSLLLEVGDVINLTLPGRRNVISDYYRLTTFSGHMLFPM